MSLYLNKIFLATLPTKCSRHNTPSRCHALTKLVKTCTSQSAKAKQTVVIVCEKRDVFASGCAVARAFPTFSRKTVAAADQLKSVSRLVGTPGIFKRKHKKCYFLVNHDNIHTLDLLHLNIDPDSDSKVLRF